MFRQKRADTLVGSIEDTYSISLNARRDMRLRTLLDSRGFESLTQLLQAARGSLSYHASRRTVFLSFHKEDLAQVNGFRLMTKNARLALDVSDDQSRYPVNSEHSTYVKRALREKIQRADVVICLIGNGTAWRTWVEWELATALEERRGICGVRLRGSRGRAPDILRQHGKRVARWDIQQITAAIEQAAAIRS